MREIKFRVFMKEWNEDGGKMFYKCFPISDDFKTWMIQFDDEFSGYDGDFTVGEDLEDPMQFTGLKDKNGKEIYEGDVVIQPKWISVGEYLPTTGEVKYLGVHFTVDCIGKWEGAHAELDGNCEVIGNIYEHPHYLKPIEDLKTSIE